MPYLAVKAFKLRPREAVLGCSLIEDAHKEEYCPFCCGTWWWTVYFVGSIMHNIRSYDDDVVLLQKGKFIGTLCAGFPILRRELV
jgi:hypothetical protein